MFVCWKLNYITPLNLIWYVPINVESLFHCREILYLIAVVWCHPWAEDVSETKKKITKKKTNFYCAKILEKQETAV